MYVKGFLVLVLVLDWTQCLPQGAGAPPALMQCRMTGFPKKLCLRRGRIRWIQFAQSRLTVEHQPRACCIRLVFTTLFNLSVTTCQIPDIWKSSLINPIPKPGKDTSQGTSYRPIWLLCPAAKSWNLCS